MGIRGRIWCRREAGALEVAEWQSGIVAECKGREYPRPFVLFGSGVVRGVSRSTEI